MRAKLQIYADAYDIHLHRNGESSCATINKNSLKYRSTQNTGFTVGAIAGIGTAKISKYRIFVSIEFHVNNALTSLNKGKGKGKEGKEWERRERTTKSICYSHPLRDKIR